MAIKQLSVFVENKEGKLREITDILAKAGIDIRALSIADTSEFGILRLIVRDPQKAKALLEKNGFVALNKEQKADGIRFTPMRKAL